MPGFLRGFFFPHFTITCRRKPTELRKGEAFDLTVACSLLFRSDFRQLLAKCRAPRTRRWLLTCAQKLHPTLGVSIHMPRDQLHVYIRDVYPDTVFQAKTAVPSLFLLVDAHATRVLSPLHVGGFREEGHFNKRLLPFARLCYKTLEAQGRRSLASPVFCWRNKTFLRASAADGEAPKLHHGSLYPCLLGIDSFLF